jgi:opacity protein-like surface antigen
VFAYRWSGCHAGANVGFEWSQQQQTLTQSGNAGVAPAPQGQQSAANNTAAGGSPQPPSNNQNGNGGGWSPPYEHQHHGQHGGGWWSDDKHHDHDKYAGDKWSQHDQQPSSGKYASYGWPQSGAHDGHDHDGHDHDWAGHDRQYAHDEYHDEHHDGHHDEHHDEHWGHEWQPHDGWPQPNPPPNKGGGQPPQQNPPPAQGNNAAGAVTQQAAALLQTPISSSNGDDVTGGVQLGCDYQIDRFVVGIQAMADFGRINASGSIPQAPQLTTSTTANNLYTATARAGYLATPAILAYVRGGAAWTQTKVAVLNNGNGQSATATFDRTGWTVGAGVEWMFARNWSAFAEYDYADFGRATGPLTGTAGLTGGPIVATLKTQIHTGLVGVNYRFDLLALSSR